MVLPLFYFGFTSCEPPLKLFQVARHSWLEPRVHQPHLNASLAHVAAMHQELRARARAQRKELFFFDNGAPRHRKEAFLMLCRALNSSERAVEDINDGTGLSALAPDHVAYITPVLQTARYDVALAV